MSEKKPIKDFYDENFVTIVEEAKRYAMHLAVYFIRITDDKSDLKTYIGQVKKLIRELEEFVDGYSTLDDPFYE